jgi:hypothetical protein
MFYLHLLIDTNIFKELVLGQGFAECDDELLDAIPDDRIAICGDHCLAFEHLKN